MKFMYEVVQYLLLLLLMCLFVFKWLQVINHNLLSQLCLSAQFERSRFLQTVNESAGKCVIISEVHLKSGIRGAVVVLCVCVHKAVSQKVMFGCKPRAASLTFLYGLCDLLRVLGEVKVGHIGFQVTNGTLPSRHTESLDGQLWKNKSKSEESGSVRKEIPS